MNNLVCLQISVIDSNGNKIQTREDVICKGPITHNNNELQQQ